VTIALVAVAIAAFAGAVCRYLVDRAVQHHTGAVLPLGTLTVNLTGSLALGFLVGLGLYHGLGDDVRTVAGTGFVGTYTTFSTFAYETVRLLEDGSTLEAFANAAASTVPGLLAVGAGLVLPAVL
jgi:fluoride exporter